MSFVFCHEISPVTPIARLNAFKVSIDPVFFLIGLFNDFENCVRVVAVQLKDLWLSLQDSHKLGIALIWVLALGKHEIFRGAVLD